MAFSPLASQQHFGHAGREVPLFQLPKSPASVAATPAFATADEFGSRKRQRGDITRTTQQSYPKTPSWHDCPTPSDRIFGSGFGQDSELVNEKYRLAGGHDTLSLESSFRLEPQHSVNEHEFRRSRRLRDNMDDMDSRSDEAPIFGPLARERNGMPRIAAPRDDGPSKTWKNTAFGLVGKVFTFGTTIFRGFTSGGGQGYDHYPLVGSDLLQEGTNRNHNQTPIPGSWCQDEFLGDFEQDSPAFMASQTPADRPSNKRRQTDRDAWVVIGDSEAQESTLSPRRKISSTSVPRSNLAGRPTASRASSRRNIVPTPRRGISNVAANGSPAQHFTSAAPLSLGQNNARRASMAPMRSPAGRPSLSGNPASCMSPEAERYNKRQAKQDKTMTSMGRQMEAMIREAQQALGTKISIEGDDMDMEDEGFVDDDY